MSELTNVEEAIKNLQIGTNKGDINMILLGATGVGKSTFINALANYLTYTNFEKALSEETLILVPFVVEVEFEDGQSQKYGAGFDNRIEDLNIDHMTTQSIRKYIFPFQENERKFSIIDTPGVNGTLKDKIIIENIINYISNLHTLDAICFLFDQSDTTHFKFIAEHVFPQLNKFATNNVIFIFNITNNMVFDDRFAFKSLRVTIEQIDMECNIEIPLLEKNVFYFENDSLEFLVAYKNGIKNMALKEHKARQSWRHSTKECWRLIRYIRGGEGDPPVKPYYVKMSQPICRIRRTIAQLIEPLVDVILLIHYNIDKLQNHQKKLNVVQHSDINDMKKQLYVPAISFDMVKLNNPITICTACANVVKVETINEWNLTDTCHKPCYLTNLCEGLVDDSKLKNCSAMDKSGNCLKCSCEYSKHRHLYYQTKIKRERIADSSSMVFTNSMEVRQLAEQLITDIQIRKSDLENEYNTIVMICARISNFLQRNALSPFKDPIEAQIKYLINREKSLGESLCDKNTVEYLEKALREYEDDKDNDIAPNNILDRIQDLYKLKYMGKQIKDLYEYRINMWMKEHLSTEYVITSFKAQKKEEPKNNEQQKFGNGRQQNEQFDKTLSSEKHTHPSHSAKKDYPNNNRQQKWKHNHRDKTDKRGPINDKGATATPNSRRGNRGGWLGRKARGGFEQRTHYEEHIGKRDTISEEKVIKRDTDPEENVINVDTDNEENVSKRDSDSESDTESSSDTIDTDEPSD